MSNYTVFRDVSFALRTLLWEAMQGDPTINPAFMNSEQNIGFADPAAMLQAGAAGTAAALSLWLYAVNVDEFRRNDPPVRTADLEWKFPPLPLVLSYLVTPVAPRESPEAAQLVLGHVMRTFYSNALTVLSNPDGQDFEELKIVLAPLTLGELTAIWEALRQPYQLSVAYQVRIVRLDVDTVVPGTRIVERTNAWSAL